MIPSVSISFQAYGRTDIGAGIDLACEVWLFLLLAGGEHVRMAWGLRQ